MSSINNTVGFCLIWYCHIESIALSFVFGVGPYVAIIAIFLFLPINVVPVHLPHPLGSRVNLFIDAYLARLLFMYATAHGI